jgi:hypothetical protein
MIGIGQFVALFLLDALGRKKSLGIEEVSAKVLEGREKGLPINEVAMRSVPGGVYSEDVEAFYGRLFSAGYAVSREGNILLLHEGRLICRKLVAAWAEKDIHTLRAAVLLFEIDPLPLLQFLNPDE